MDGNKEQSNGTIEGLYKYAIAKKPNVWLRDMASTTTSADRVISKYTKSQLVEFLKNPGNYESELRDASMYAFRTSMQYRRLIWNFASMMIFSYVLVPSGLNPAEANPDEVYAQYIKAAQALEVMNIPHEFNKISNICFIQDVFYGYIYEGNNSFAIQELDPKYCKIDAIEDGVYTFSWDSSYFNGKDTLLEKFAPEFTTAHNAYKNDSSARWYHMNSDNTICIKINETDLTPIPPFVSLLPIIVDIEDYRAITKSASETSNYKILTLEIPVDKAGELLIPEWLCIKYYDLLASQLPENIGIALTPMKVADWKFENAGMLTDTDMVSRAEDTFWRSGGVSGVLFGAGENPSAALAKLSTTPDMTICFRLLRQFERWINRRLKRMTGKIKFAAEFHNVTTYNHQEVLDQYLRLGQYGKAVRSDIAALMSRSPLRDMNKAYLENNVLKLYENDIPLQSSNTISGEVGRPTNESQGKTLTDEGESSAEAGKNDEN